MPTFDYPASAGAEGDDDLSRRQARAAQSTFAHRRARTAARDTPDYYALRVMNTMLGGLFQSRLNHNIREEKGYSYGVARASRSAGARAVPCRRRHRDGQDRQRADRVHEGAAATFAASGRRPTTSSRRRRRASCRACRRVRVGRRRERQHRVDLYAGTAGGLLPAVRARR